MRQWFKNGYPGGILKGGQTREVIPVNPFKIAANLGGEVDHQGQVLGRHNFLIPYIVVKTEFTDGKSF